MQLLLLWSLSEMSSTYQTRLLLTLSLTLYLSSLHHLPAVLHCLHCYEPRAMLLLLLLLLLMLCAMFVQPGLLCDHCNWTVEAVKRPLTC
jgi:hypothetical protein